MEKRTFIPPHYRPYVRGSQLKASPYAEMFTRIEQDRTRRELICNLISGKENFFDLDQEAIVTLLVDLFPSLSHLRGQNV